MGYRTKISFIDCEESACKAHSQQTELVDFRPIEKQTIAAVRNLIPQSRKVRRTLGVRGKHADKSYFLFVVFKKIIEIPVSCRLYLFGNVVSHFSRCRLRATGISLADVLPLLLNS
jgi:hypothetical protein